jgi:hypothetical protein
MEEISQVHAEFTQFLRSASDQEAADIVRRLRAGATVQSLVHQMKTGSLLLELSVGPPRTSRYSLGVVSDIPNAFRTRSNPYLTSIVLKSKFDPAGPPASILRNTEHDLSSVRAMYEAPYHTAQLVNSIIDSALPSAWTTVTTDDQLLRQLLRSYFASTYIFLPFFHKDYFLQDMATGRNRFCSSLLANCIFAGGCVSKSSCAGIHCVILSIYLSAKLQKTADAFRVLESLVSLLQVFGRSSTAMGYRIKQAKHHHNTSRYDPPLRVWHERSRSTWMVFLRAGCAYSSGKGLFHHLYLSSK